MKQKRYPFQNKICQIAELQEILHKFKAEGKKIVSTSGCFDLLHAGHAAYLQEAKNEGDILVVMLNSDASVRMLKGVKRPIVPQEERAFLLAAFGFVDYIVLFDERTPCRLIELFQPDCIVKGGDYEGKQIPELETAAAYGGTVRYVSFLKGRSSTNLIEKIRQEGVESL